MDDANNIINKIIEEHHKIRDNVKLAGDSLNDVEAAFTLSKVYSGWTQSSAGELASKRDMLIRALSALDEGLNAHFGYEEKYLPPLFGDLLMKGLLHEHGKVRGNIAGAKKDIAEMEVDLSDSQKLLSRKMVVQESVNHLLQSIEEHAGHEEIVLLMIRGGMEEGSG
jgi:cob(I)alamin adenosyltransferase